MKTETEKHKLEWEERDEETWDATDYKWQYTVRQYDSEFIIDRWPAVMEEDSDDGHLEGRAQTLKEAVTMAEQWNSERYNDYQPPGRLDTRESKKHFRALAKDCEIVRGGVRRLLDVMTPTKGIKGVSKESLAKQVIRDVTCALFVVARDRKIEDALLDEVFQHFFTDSQSEADLRKRIETLLSEWDSINEGMALGEEEKKERQERFHLRMSEAN